MNAVSSKPVVPGSWAGGIAEYRGRGSILIVVLLALIAAPAAAQDDATTWSDLLESRTRVSYRYTHPPSPGECVPAVLPSRGYLTSPGHRQAIGRTWSPGANQSRWEPVRAPMGSDTLAVRIVEVWCGPTGRNVLVEYDGYYLEIENSHLARIEPTGALLPGVLLVDGADGNRKQATLREICFSGSCQLHLTDAEVIASEAQLALAERQERERARFAEGERRAETQAVQRVQAGASVGAQMNAVLNRQQLETYQRLGATPDQATAIVQRRVLPGMTAAMVRAAIGEPRETRQEGTGARAVTTWVYPDRQIVISGGVVTSIR